MTISVHYNYSVTFFLLSHVIGVQDFRLLSTDTEIKAERERVSARVSETDGQERKRTVDVDFSCANHKEEYKIHSTLSQET